MNGVRTRKPTAQEAKGESTSKELNGSANGHLSRDNAAASGAKSTENIFLFYPNIIGSSLPIRLPLSMLISSAQAIPASSSPSHPSTTCRFTREPALSYTAFPAFSTPLMAWPRAISNKRQSSALSLTWSPIAAPQPACSSSSLPRSRHGRSYFKGS